LSVILLIVILLNAILLIVILIKVVQPWVILINSKMPFVRLLDPVTLPFQNVAPPIVIQLKVTAPFHRRGQ
jgi:hypothetical protein